MAKNDHINRTQAISAAGYSLSAMLLALACALYLGWLPASTKQAGLENEPQAVPVVKSPEAPPKVRVAKPKEEEQAPEQPKVEVQPSDDEPAQTKVAEPETAQTETPVEQPELPADEAEQKPFDSARILPRDPEAIAPSVGEEDETQPVPLPKLPTEEPKTETVQPDGSVQPDIPQLPDPSERLTEEDTGQPQNLTVPEETQPKPSEPVEQQQPRPGRALTQTDDDRSVPESSGPIASNEQPADDTAVNKAPATPDANADGEPQKQVRVVPGEPKVRVVPGEPKVRIIAPPAKTTPEKRSPSVVIRIEPKEDDDLDVLPRPTIEPRDKPRVIKQSETLVVKETPERTTPSKRASDPVVVPRAKPKKRLAAKAAEPELKDEKPPRSATPKTDALPANSSGDDQERAATVVGQRAPMPKPKPARLARPSADPAYTATVTPRKKVVEKPRKKVQRQAVAKTKRKRVRVIRPPKSEASNPKRQRTKVARARILNREGNRRLPAYSVSMDQDTYCLAIAIYYEAGRKNLQNQVIVSRDILHRVESGNFPNSVCEVVYQYAHRRGRCRYAFACDGLPDRPRNKSVWRRAKMLAKAQISCGSRCGCYLQKTTLVSSSQGRKRPVIRCQAGYKPPRKTPTLRRISRSETSARLEIQPVALRAKNEQISALGRADR